jgi:hypothetical protein
MGLPTRSLPRHVPRRLPVGAKYVIEGFGGREGHLRVTARYLVLPDGRRINVPLDLARPSARSTAARRGTRSDATPTGRHVGNIAKKFG